MSVRSVIVRCVCECVCVSAVVDERCVSASSSGGLEGLESSEEGEVSWIVFLLFSKDGQESRTSVM